MAERIQIDSTDVAESAISRQLYYYRARYYDPTPGRFLREDPLGFRGGINAYAYTFSNPINWNDPLGLWGIAFGNDAGTSFTNFGFGDPWLYFSPRSFFQLGESAAATLDGLNPFGNPLATRGYYNPCDSNNQLSHALGKGAQIALESAAGLGTLKFANGLFMPNVLYHFTSVPGAIGILETGTIAPGAGLYGTGVYLTGFNSATVAMLQGAASTDAAIAISAEGLAAEATYFPGIYIVRAGISLLP